MSASTAENAKKQAETDHAGYMAIGAKEDYLWELAQQAAGIAASKLVGKPVPGWAALKAFIFLEEIVSKVAEQKRENERIVGDALAETLSKLIK